jgi:LacI family transcriptional regulator
MSNPLRIAVLLETGRSIDRQLLQGIGQYAHSHGTWTFHIVSESLDRLMLPPNLWNAAGVIARLNSRCLARTVTASRVPFISVDSAGNSWTRPLESGHSRVVVDLAGAVELAKEYLSSRGFRHQAFVDLANRDGSNSGSGCFDESARWFRHRFICDLANGSDTPIWLRERHQLTEWLQHLPKPLGILARDDECGLQVLEACRDAQIIVPNEVAVIGVGNDELTCAMANPPLTSVSLNAIECGYRAALSLDNLIRRSNQMASQLLVEPAGIVIRSSTDVEFSDDSVVSATRSAIRCRRLQDLSIDGLARAIGISRRTLELRFRKQTGRTLLEEIKDVRLAKAKMALTETELPIAEVALLSGYRSASYLADVFRKELGISPAKYRQRLTRGKAIASQTCEKCKDS